MIIDSKIDNTAEYEPANITKKHRLLSIDVLRGLVMALMVLDHARDFFTISGQNVRDVHDTAFFLTRWITHFCAPVFMMLAGVSAYLYGSNGRTKEELRNFLITRGLWLIFIEFTIVRLAWTFSFDISFFIVQVIFALGASMLFLAGFIYLPRKVLFLLSVGLIAGHNLFDTVKAVDFGNFAILWNLLHQPGFVEYDKHFQIWILYPIVPWIGVMAIGYLMGPIFKFEREKRLTILIYTGATLTIFFFVFRYLNLYGDPNPWIQYDTLTATALSFLNTEKYPPSLLFLAMTLGPALLILALIDGAHGRFAKALATIGLIPFLFYILHIYAIHCMAILYTKITGGSTDWLFAIPPLDKPEAFHSMRLVELYVAWIIILLLIYPICKLYAKIKRTHSGWWWSYL